MKNKGVIIAVISLLVVIIIALLDFIAVNFLSDKKDDSDDEKVSSGEKTVISTDKNSVTQNANFVNWGFSCEINGDMYYSDYKTGIYRVKDQGNELFVTGIYTDLCGLGNKLFCVDYYTKDGSVGDDFMRIVWFDLKTGEKTIVNFGAEEDSYYIFMHKTDNKIYFCLDDGELYTIDKNGNTEYIGISNAVGVTDSGIYTKNGSQYGLRLVSFENKLIREYDTLSKNIVNFLYEFEGVLYVSVDAENGEDQTYIKVDAKTGKILPLEYLHKYGVVKRYSYYNGKLYVLIMKADSTDIYLVGKNDELTLLTSIDNSEDFVGLPLFTFADKKMMVAFPYCKTSYMLYEVNSMGDLTPIS